MSNKETRLQNQIRLALGPLDSVAAWRNNVGRALVRDNWVAFGVGGKGGSDLIGIVDGRFFALEVKTAKGRVSPEQEQFLRCVRYNGGFAAVVRSIEDALAAVERCRNGACE